MDSDSAVDPAVGREGVPLADQACGTCTAATPPISADAVAGLLGELPHWRVVGGRLVRNLVVADFATALVHANQIGAVAEAEGHHPDLIVAWGRLGITLYTHAIGGLSKADFVLAAKIDRTLG